MAEPVRLLLWTDAPGPYQAAIDAAGLAPRVAIETLGQKALPSDAQCATVEAMLAWGAPAGLLPRMTKLRWAQALTAGVESWLALPDLPAGLALTCARGTHREAMPENILGALFHITKPYAAIAAEHHTATWTRRASVPLNGATLGILGVGAIGADLAKIANAMGMRVIGTRRGDTPVAGVELLPMEAVLAQSDYVVLLLPATPETESIIDARRLSLMKPSAWVINFGRGALIDDAALIAAVMEKRIAGAILDVFREEPLPSAHPFWRTPGIMVLPHIGGMHPGRNAIVARLFVDNLGRFLDGRPLRELVDRDRGY